MAYVPLLYLLIGVLYVALRVRTGDRRARDAVEAAIMIVFWPMHVVASDPPAPFVAEDTPLARVEGWLDRLHGRDEGVGNGDDGVSGLDAGRHQGEAHGVGSVPDADAIRTSAPCRELSLETLHLGTADKGCGTQRFAEGLYQFLLEKPVRRLQIQKRHWG